VPEQKQQGHKGVKDARFDLMPPEWLWGVSQVYGFGARKYADRNWERGYSWMKAYGAAQRHEHLWLAGQSYDVDENGQADGENFSGLHHLLHASWMMAALYTFEARGIGDDDRPTGGNIDFMKATLLNPEEIAAAKRGE